MNLKISFVFAIVCVISFGEARPRYVAIPLEDLEASGLIAEPILEQAASNQRLITYDPEESYNEDLYSAPSEKQDIILVEEENPRQKRQPGHGGHDHVDYGAYTGGHGAFGWYTDHPVGKHY